MKEQNSYKLYRYVLKLKAVMIFFSRNNIFLLFNSNTEDLKVFYGKRYIRG